MTFLAACYFALDAAIILAFAPHMLGGFPRRNRWIEFCLWFFMLLIALRHAFWGTNLLVWQQSITKLAQHPLIVVISVASIIPVVLITWQSHWLAGRYGAVATVLVGSVFAGIWSLGPR